MPFKYWIKQSMFSFLKILALSTTPIEEFVSNSKLCSEQGKKLARDICDWHKKTLKEAK